MLFEFFMNFLNIENKKFKKKYSSVKKISWGGGFFFRKAFLSHFISRFMLFSTLIFFLEILKSAPSLSG